MTSIARQAAVARDWVEQGRSGALVRVTDNAGLGPRPTDELLLVDDSGRTEGTLLGGTLDSTLTDAARTLLAGTAPLIMLGLDIGDDDAEQAGLTCGGHVNVLVQRLDHVPLSLWDALADGRPAALATALDGAGAAVHRPKEPADGSLGSPALDDATRSVAEPLFARPGRHVARASTEEGEAIVEAWHPVPRLVVVGASALSTALVAQAVLLGWPAEVVTDAAEALAQAEALEAGDLVIVVDHDHDLATPVLAAALAGPAGYVGGLGSRHTQAERRARLQAAGLDEATMGRYHGPTGLDLGARTPAETAVSIVAEVLAERSGRPAAPLAGTSGRIGGG
jgi:xanthine dehydrogenase accessory factor